jgi:Glycosyl transferase family 8.
MERRSKRYLRNPYSSQDSRSSLRTLAVVTAISAVLCFSLYSYHYSNTTLDHETHTISSLRSTESFNPDNHDSNKVSYSDAPTIAYAVSLTSCEETPSLIDGAAVLLHSIHMSSIRNPLSSSKYDYRMYAIVHNSATACRPILEKIGYTVQQVDVPVPVADIQGDFLRENVPQNGCCGELEFIKLWAYTLVEHPFVVHLDLDTVVLKPMDELFDAAIRGDTRHVSAVMWPQEHHLLGSGIEEEEEKEGGTHQEKPIHAFFTRDYNMRSAGKKPVGVQGGFLVIRPSMQVFEEFQDIIRKGDYRQGGGWGGKGYGPFYGSMTFQGIIPYYYDELHPGTAIELNRCVYNQMADNPRDKRTVNDVVSGKCRDGREDCEDCRERNIEDVVTAHFTLCQKPWHCLPHDQDMLQHRLCRKLFGEWYRIRADLERPNVPDDLVVGEGGFQADHFRGFCKGPGKKGYIPLKIE